MDKIEHAVPAKRKAELADPAHVKECLKAHCDKRRALNGETGRNRASIAHGLTETPGRLARRGDLRTREVIEGFVAETDIAEATAKRSALEA